MAGMISVLILVIIVNFYLQKYFNEYAIRKQDERNQKIVSLITNQYQEKMSWNADYIQNIGISLLEEGLIIKLTDKSGDTVWDAMEYNSGICHRMMEDIKIKMSNRYPSLNGGFSNKIYLINSGKNPIGTLQIGYYAPFYYTDSEFFFINALNHLMLIVTIGTLIISIIIGLLISRRLSIPISQVIHTAGQIANGFYDIRVNQSSKIKEVQELINSINNLVLSLDKQEQLRKQLTQDISHELRTPLTTLQSHIEAMLDGIWTPSTERLKSFHDEILRLTSLVNDLTVLSRYEYKKENLNKSWFNLKKLVSDILLIYENQFSTSEIQAKVSSKETDIYADKDKITQVITNLISNAIKYTPQKGVFEIRIRKEKKMVKLNFINSGDGIPSEDLPFVFERFYRADKSRNRSTGGAGIGLSIAKQIVLAHKGYISAASTVNQSTVFTVTLPIHEEDKE